MLTWLLLCRFKSVVAEIDETSIPDYIRQYTDAHRVHMFDIIMQFRAIFYDGGDCAVASDAAPVSTGSASGKAGLDNVTSGEGARSPVSPVLASWAHQCMETFTDRLDTLLPSCARYRLLPPLVHACTFDIHVLVPLFAMRTACVYIIIYACGK
jgi:conserved oligomeric Golgi complex subunit 8